ncbi:hypothetical protein CHELA40_13746 [Chelatococcus asaccharovorans]|nr:hypothetical protein CHELA40_13746 [Chelatococcus asaccharovorans]CAH1675912.1 hypothetical protein CHELA17_61879 [Chelatococcus asaccharovorans]
MLYLCDITQFLTRNRYTRPLESL